MVQPRIRVLPPEIANKISAGEVVERPASAVKELVENSIDAGASRITVEILKGGAELIKVSDDGCGMSSNDAELSLLRHSTSKLNDPAEIGHSATLGFRGEALPSIAAVSKMRLRTRSSEHETGIVIHAEGGSVKRKEISASPPGTEITAEHLFFNTPARKKFMKSVPTEAARVSEAVAAQAAGRLNIHFELSHNGRSVFKLPPAKQLEDRILQIFGGGLRDYLLPFDSEKDGARVHGIFSAPGYSRTQSSQMLFYVNGRPVKSRLITHAVLEPFRPIIPSGRFPFAVLFLEIDRGLVDVNVHPGKTEVKFMDPGGIHEFLKTASGKALKSGRSSPSAFDMSREDPSGRQSVIFEAVGKYSSREEFSQPGFDFARPFAPGAPETRNSSSASVLFQSRYSYIIAENSEGLLIIDQHAAHEKILYEKLKVQHKNGAVSVQQLLSPPAVELGGSESSFVEENLGAFQETGFEAEVFGRNTFLLRTVPSVFEKSDPGELFTDMMSDIIEAGKPAEAARLLDRIISSCACRGAVKAGDKLEHEEMNWLVSTLFTLQSPFFCPHGRPSVIRLSFPDIERKFKR